MNDANIPFSSRLAKLKSRAKRITGLDQPIFFTILARSWSTVAGLLTVFLITHFLLPTEQGYYYTFSSLVAIQMVFELGFSFVILQMAAHERSRMTVFSNDSIEGDPVAHARIASVFQKAVRWYSVAALVMASALLSVGTHFFSKYHQAGGAAVQWLAPWLLVVLAAAFTFQIDPLISFIEGCGQVAGVAKMRLFQAVIGSFLAWSSLLSHHGLYAPGLLIVGQAVVGGWFLFRNNGTLLLHLYRFKPGNLGVSWKQEIWPFQWRIALSWASAYFIFQLFNPVLFAFRGPSVAGKMGMSLSIATALSAVAISWITTKAAPFGSLIAKNEIGRLDELFRSAVVQSTTLLAAGILITLGVFAVLGHYNSSYLTRVLPLPTFALLLLTVLSNHLVTCQAYYLRAHKQEPLLWFWVTIAAASIIGIIWAAKYYGATGATVVYFILGGLCRLCAATYVFLKKRREWHQVWYVEQDMLKTSRP